ncbi:hypothetical protein [Nocardioides nanhaiensis]|uniref:Uncharacterized protein n=1 Tax=Nocardioides nanhaiensis TaxID=1476871 RepID=A0ABP8X3Q9_9ACTN
MTDVPDIAAVMAYLPAGYPQQEVVDALAAETADQSTRCRVTPYNESLRAALMRRVHRHMEMKNLPIGIAQNDEFGGVRVGSTDPEVRRLEAPYRRLVIG